MRDCFLSQELHQSDLAETAVTTQTSEKETWTLGFVMHPRSGAWPRVVAPGPGRHPAAEEEEEALRAGISLGRTVVDTSGGFGGGLSEALIGRVIADQREDIRTLDGIPRELEGQVASNGRFARSPIGRHFLERQRKDDVTKNYGLHLNYMLAADRRRMWTLWGSPMNAISVSAPNVTTSWEHSWPAQSSQGTATGPSSQSFAVTDANEISFSVTIDLSQDAKANLARANNNQAAANRILAFVDANRAGNSDEPNSANESWSQGEPSLEQEYQQLTGDSSPTSNNAQASQDGAVTITLSEYNAESVSVDSGTGSATTTASAASAQYDSVSLSVASGASSIEIVQSDQSQSEAAQIGSTSPLSITA